jgi:hypothetical protein
MKTLTLIFRLSVRRKLRSESPQDRRSGSLQIAIDYLQLLA